MSDVALIDFNGMFCRHYYARGDTELNAARLSCVGQIRALAADYDHAAICVDSPKSWRRDLCDDYKANRPPKDAVMIEQLRRTLDTLRDDGFPMFGVDGYEADDVMASAAAQLCGGHAVTIISADKDMLQCLSEAGHGVVRLNPNYSPPGLMGVTDLYRASGLTPAQIPHWLALMGDNVDNIPGVAGVGEKTAAKLLVRHGTVDGVIAAAHAEDGLTARQCNAILEAESRDVCNLDMALQLATLRTDLELDLAPLFKPRVPKTETSLEDDDMDDDSIPEATPTQPSEREPAAVEAEPVSSELPPRAMAVAPTWERGLEPRDLKEAKTLARYVVDSRLFSAFGTPQAALLVIMAGRELGMGVMSSLRSFHIVEGKPAPSAQLLMGLCLRSPQCELFEVVEDGRDRAVVRTKRRDWTAAKEWEFTAEDAKDAGLMNKNNWKMYRRDMLLNRCIARAARFTCPEVVANLYDLEEAEGVVE